MNDGESALTELRRGTIDVALIDLMMPGLDGLQLLSRMQAENIQKDVVMISGHVRFRSLSRRSRVAPMILLRSPSEKPMSSL